MTKEELAANATDQVIEIFGRMPPDAVCERMTEAIAAAIDAAVAEEREAMRATLAELIEKAGAVLESAKLVWEAELKLRHAYAPGRPRSAYSDLEATRAYYLDKLSEALEKTEPPHAR